MPGMCSFRRSQPCCMSCSVGGGSSAKQIATVTSFASAHCSCEPLLRRFLLHAWYLHPPRIVDLLGKRPWFLLVYRLPRAVLRPALRARLRAGLRVDLRAGLLHNQSPPLPPSTDFYTTQPLAQNPTNAKFSVDRHTLGREGRGGREGRRCEATDVDRRRKGAKRHLQHGRTFAARQSQAEIVTCAGRCRT
eukprot:scaffold7897_cov248-Pinguiococcus_pyrenoidosus.AAC.7